MSPSNSGQGMQGSEASLDVNCSQAKQNSLRLSTWRLRGLKRGAGAPGRPPPLLNCSCALGVVHRGLALVKWQLDVAVHGDGDYPRCSTLTRSHQEKVIDRPFSW